MRFKDLPIGSTFDFASPDWRLNSFTDLCKKTSKRGYQEVYAPFTCHQIGTINCEVFHVILAKPGDMEQCNLCTGSGVKFSKVQRQGKPGLYSRNCNRCNGQGQVAVGSRNAMPKAFYAQK